MLLFPANFTSLQKKEVAETIRVENTFSKSEKYRTLLPQIEALFAGESDVVANSANLVAALKETFGFFWVGFYFVKPSKAGDELVLGPFQGPVACTRISKGKGVCGMVWLNKETILVEDVDQFPGHIACSALSKSEIVVPVMKNNKVVAVLDVDSDQLSDFDQDDKNGLEQLVLLFSQTL